MEFISENCIFGQNILRLVARGNSVIAEILRLSSYVPTPFRSLTKAEEKRQQENYEEVLPTFAYLKQRQEHENKVTSSKKLASLDEELKICHLSIIERIYCTFESIHRYITDLNAYIDDLNNGLYVQRSLESVMSDADGRQLLCEALYLYGVMLLMVDLLFPGSTRERILIFNLRHTVEKASSITSIDSVCKLLRSTDFQANAKIPVNYPEFFFKRVLINEDYIHAVIGCLQFEDVYHQIPTYPLLAHRTTALATQSAMLYVCLFFAPQILTSQQTRMREIVEKFFTDNWILSYYMGWTANLVDSWDGYPSAKQALQNAIEQKAFKKLANYKRAHFIDLIERTQLLLSDGPLNKKIVLNESYAILKLLRDCNVTLRWLILHTSPRRHVAESKKAISLRKEVLNELQLSVTELFDLLFNTANIELSFVESYKKLVGEKESKWLESRVACHKHVLELSDEFMASRPIAKLKKNDRLSQWFKKIAEQILNLDLSNVALSQLKIVQICQNINEIKEFHNLKHSAGIIQAMDEIVEYLQVMDKVSTLDEENLIVLAVISDMSYSWRLIEEYTPPMQNVIESDPYQVERLRAVFLKMSSGLELPLLRINQAKSSDMVSVSAYYSGVVVEYIKTVLQVIPKSMFKFLKRIVDLQTSMQSIPVKLETTKILEFSQLEQRHKMSELTEKVAVFAGGITMMKSTLVGVVKIDPKQLLEDGVRRELIDQVQHTLSDEFTFHPKKKDLKSCLCEVKRIMIGFQSSFEYIQDYLGINCLKLWQDELKNLITFHVEQELNELTKQHLKWKNSEDGNQNFAFAKTKSAQNDIIPTNFMGRITQQILRRSHPKTTYYVPETRTWFDMKTRSPSLSHTVMKDLLLCIGVPGVTGLKKILSFYTIKILQEVVHLIRKISSRVPEISSIFLELRERFRQKFIIDDVQSLVPKLAQKLGKHQNFCVVVLEKIAQIGQMQILQTLASAELNSECKLYSRLLASVVDNVNGSFLVHIKQFQKNSNTLMSTKGNNSFASKLTDQLTNCGLDEPMKSLYVTSTPIEFLVESIMFCLISQMNKICIYKSQDETRESDLTDGTALVMGIATIMKQFHPSELDQLLKYLSQYAQSNIAASTAIYSTNRSKDSLKQEFLTAVHLLRKIASHSSLQMAALDAIIPPHLACL